MPHGHASEALTKNQALVMGALSEATGPLSAYTILDQLRDDGLRAPLQVYRALDKLVEFGLVHRLESLNAFVACRQPGCDSHERTAFMICDDCGSVIEITDKALARRLKSLAQDASFALKKSTIELRGLCAACTPM
ncbi:MAG: transcriptional repressor [Roseitalea sp.]|jgi:Fur family zinc uptake transcriptional regulator|nr:transcriptional repressor [Roseitalea sp.]MBO6741466.1 transcriptional repressor [Roseitalea sp.]